MARVGVMLAKPFETRYLKNFPSYVIVQPKLDGSRMKAVPFLTGYKLISSQGNEINSLPHINEALDKAFGLKGPILDGEAYIHGASQQTLRSIVGRSVNLHSKSDMVEFHIFDIVSDDAQVERCYELSRLFGYTIDSAISKVESIAIPSRQAEVEKMCQIYLDQGYEGIIVRNPNAFYQPKRTADLLKLKPDQFDTYIIMNVLEAISIEGKPKGMVGAFECVSESGDVFRVGAGRLTHHERTYIWQNRYFYNAGGWKVEFRYLKLTDKGIPREPTAISIVPLNEPTSAEREPNG